MVRCKTELHPPLKMCNIDYLHSEKEGSSLEGCKGQGWSEGYQRVAMQVSAMCLCSTSSRVREKNLPSESFDR